VIILPLLLLGALAYFMRHVLIFTGLLKGPVLRYFEKYGDEEDFYNPIIPTLGWGGITLLLLDTWLRYHHLYTLWGLRQFSVLLLISAFLAFEIARNNQHGIWLYPRWAHDLSARTSRIERRRLAYMWLHLSPRLRLTYNSNTDAFMQWADLVILATLFY